MKNAACSLAGAATLIVALGACTTVVESAAPAKSHSASAPASSAAPSSSAPASTSPPLRVSAGGAAGIVAQRHRSVGGRVGLLRRHRVRQLPAGVGAARLRRHDRPAYQQFVNGFTCTGSQDLSEVSESGNQVTFSLSATDTCNGQVQHFTGTDTVENGKIVAADVHQD